MKEKAIIFGKSKSLVGILTESSFVSDENDYPAVIILNAGLIHRIGPNRIHVNLARKMADSGFTVLRYDFSGIGDSISREDGLYFKESAVEETKEAMDYLSLIKNINKFILIGICSGGNIAFNSACCDNRIVGGVFINGFFVDDKIFNSYKDIFRNNTQERFYKKNLFNLKSWGRLILGKSDFNKIKKVIYSKIKKILFRIRKMVLMFETDKFNKWSLLLENKKYILLIYSEGSPTLDEYNFIHSRCIKELELDEYIDIKIINDVDHVFTLIWSQETLINMINQWIIEKRDKFNYPIQIAIKQNSKA